jgi:hypothetical protein
LSRAWLPPTLIALAGLLGPRLPGLAGELGAYLWLGALPGLGVTALAGGGLSSAARWTAGLAISPLLSATLGALLASRGVPLATGALWIGGLGATAAILGGFRARPPGVPATRAPGSPTSRAFRWWPLVAAALMALPCVLNPWIRVRSDTWIHGALVFEILDHGIPPQDPRFAGLALNYVWIFNFFIAQLAALGGGNPFTFMVVFNVVNAALFLRVVWHMAVTVWGDSRPADGALALAALGFNAGAWLLWPLRLIRALTGHERGWAEIQRQIATHYVGTVDVLFSLSAPFALMSSPLDKFLLGNALSYAWVLFALFLWALARWAEERSAGALAWAAAAAAGMLFVHGVVGLSVLPVALGALALAALLSRRLAWLPAPGPLVACAAAIALGMALAAPYTWAIARAWARPGTGVHHSYFGFGWVMPWTLLTSCGVALGLALKPAADAFRARRPGAALLALFAVAMIAFALVVRLPSRNENKFPFQCFLPIAVLGGAAFLPAARNLLARRGAVLGGAILGALFVVPTALTLCSYITDPGGRESPWLHPAPAEVALDAWVRATTPLETAIVDDGFRVQMAVQARRRLYLGDASGPELAGFPRDEVIERHAVVADLYGPGADLDRDAAALGRLGFPVYVLYRPGAPQPAAARPDLFEPAYDREGYVVYRVRIP